MPVRSSRSSAPQVRVLPRPSLLLCAGILQVSGLVTDALLHRIDASLGSHDLIALWPLPHLLFGLGLAFALVAAARAAREQARASGGMWRLAVPALLGALLLLASALAAPRAEEVPPPVRDGVPTPAPR